MGWQTVPGQQIMGRQVLFRYGIGLEGPDGLLANGIGLQLLCGADQLANIVQALQGIIASLFASFPGGHDLTGIRDIDPLISLQPHPAKHLLIKKKEPVKFCRDIVAISKANTMGAGLRLQFECPVGGDIDLRDLCHPIRVPAEETADPTDAGGEQAISRAVAGLCDRVAGEYRQPERKLRKQRKTNPVAVKIETIAILGKNAGDRGPFDDFNM